MDTEKKIELLAKYLEIDPSDIEQSGYDKNTFEVAGDGEEYLVVDEDTARELAEESVKNFIVDLGITGFTPAFQDWILSNALDYDFEQCLREVMSSDISDLELETSSLFENRLIEELVDCGILDDEDFVLDENGEIDYYTLKDSVDLESKKEEFLNELVEDAGDPQEWYIQNFGKDSIKYLVERGLATLDEDKIASKVISEDGIASLLATYDGDEIKLGEDMFAYRTN